MHSRNCHFGNVILKRLFVEQSFILYLNGMLEIRPCTESILSELRMCTTISTMTVFSTERRGCVKRVLQPVTLRMLLLLYRQEANKNKKAGRGILPHPSSFCRVYLSAHYEEKSEILYQLKSFCLFGYNEENWSGASWFSRCTQKPRITSYQLPAKRNFVQIQQGSSQLFTFRQASDDSNQRGHKATLQAITTVSFP